MRRRGRRERLARLVDVGIVGDLDADRAAHRAGAAHKRRARACRVMQLLRRKAWQMRDLDRHPVCLGVPSASGARSGAFGRLRARRWSLPERRDRPSPSHEGGEIEQALQARTARSRCRTAHPASSLAGADGRLRARRTSWVSRSPRRCTRAGSSAACPTEPPTCSRPLLLPRRPQYSAPPSSSRGGPRLRPERGGARGPPQ